MRPVGSWLHDRKVHRFETLEEAMDAARGVDLLCKKMAASDSCPDCKGSGKCNCEDCRGTCAVCGGTGKDPFPSSAPSSVRFPSHEPCDACNGTGAKPKVITNPPKGWTP